MPAVLSGHTDGVDSTGIYQELPWGNVIHLQFFGNAAKICVIPVGKLGKPCMICKPSSMVVAPMNMPQGLPILHVVPLSKRVDMNWGYMNTQYNFPNEPDQHDTTTWPKQVRSRKRFPCSNCSERFAQQKILNKHSKLDFKKNYCADRIIDRTDHRIGLIVCEICGKNFPSHTKLKDHNRFHTDEEPYKCGICGKVSFIITTLN